MEKAALAVLDARAQFPDATLADLYHPTTMPPVPAKAQTTLPPKRALSTKPPGSAKQLTG